MLSAGSGGAGIAPVGMGRGDRPTLQQAMPSPLETAAHHQPTHRVEVFQSQRCTLTPETHKHANKKFMH